MSFYCKSLFVLLIVGLVGCGQMENISELGQSTSQIYSRDGKKTACVSFQGNGVYFTSHVGALISLFENNYVPKFATGGSSGAILASVSRALVENPSLTGPDGTFEPRQAAVLLASSSPVIESVLFLPRFTRPLDWMDSLDVFLSGSALGVLRADPKDALVHAESIVGQAALVVDFFRTVDFSRVVMERNLAIRESKMAALWKEFALAISVSPDDFANAVFTPREILIEQNEKNLVAIQDRFFKLFRSKQDNLVDNYKVRQQTWNELLFGNYKLFRLDSPERRKNLLMKMLEAIKNVESFDSLAATLSGDFLLADPDRVYRAFEGFDSRTNRSIEIPSNVVIHSTARRAVRQAGEWREIPGLESLHQVYMTNAQLVDQAAVNLLADGKNPLQPSEQGAQPVVPSERLVVTSMNLGSALAISTGEPTAFKRFPVALDNHAAKRFEWLSSQEKLIGSGGWLEKVSIGTARQFEACAPENVDIYFYTSDGEGVNRFAKMVFLGLFVDRPLRGLLARQIENPSFDIAAALAGKLPNVPALPMSSVEQELFKSTLESADKLFGETRELRARKGSLPVNFDFVNPSEAEVNQSSVNVVFRSNRRAMMLASYEFTKKLAMQRGLGDGNLLLWNRHPESVLGESRPEAVLALIDDLMPRLSLTTEF